MTQVRIAELKSRLSEFLRLVRDGGTVAVFDRDRLVARIVPADEGHARLQVRTPRADAPALADLRLPEALRLDTDPVALLLDEREAPA